jgi:hypothetical protein
VLAVELVILDVREDHPAQAEHLVERGPILLSGQQGAVLGDDALPLLLERLGRPGQRLPLPDLAHVPGQRGERYRQVVTPAAVVVVETVPCGHVEPRVPGRVQRGEPAGTRLAPPGQRVEHGGRVGAVGEQVVQAALDGQRGQPLELVVGPVHDELDAGHHARDHLVGDLRERLLAELEEHHVGAVPEEQELGVVVPHLGEQVEAAVEVLPHVVVLRHPGRPGDHRQVVHLGQVGYPYLLDLPDELLDARLPALVQGVPVAVVVTRALLEVGQPPADLLGIGHRVRRDVHPPVEDAVLDAQRGRQHEHPRAVRPDRRVRDLRGHRVERRHRLGEVHRVVEPEAPVVRGLEPGEVRVHAAPLLGAGDVGNLGR